jgi:tetratricopeptide (TPR) repeat protein
MVRQRPITDGHPFGRLLIAVAASVFLHTQAVTGGAQSSATALFELYRAGEYDAVEKGLRQVKDWPRFVDEVKDKIAKWPPAMAAAFALEASAERLAPGRTISFGLSHELLEAGCQAVTRSALSGAFVLQWDLASVAMEEGFGLEMPGGEGPGHLEHAVRRFPRDPRFGLAKVRGQESGVYTYYYVGRRRATGPEPVNGSTTVALSAVRRMGLLADDFQEFQNNPIVGIEATVRAAFWRIASGRHADGLRLLDDVERRTRGDDSRNWERYLGWLFRGRASGERGQHDDAIVAYRTALEAWPEAESARSALAASLFVAGRRREAQSLIDAMLAAPPARRDPWAWYPFGDHRYWRHRLATLRGMLR